MTNEEFYEAVGELLGLEPEEEFTVRQYPGRYSITDGGLFVQNLDGDYMPSILCFNEINPESVRKL